MVTFYRQCVLNRLAPKGRMQQVAWIPEQFATVARVLRLRIGGTWVDGWIVSSVSDQRVTDDAHYDGFGGGVEQRPDAHAAIRQHRRNTGDAQLKVHR